MMISSHTTNSARFLKMLTESQLLYFHLAIRADNNGIVEDYPITSLLKTSPVALEILCSNGFIKKINNYEVIILDDVQEPKKKGGDDL